MEGETSASRTRIPEKAITRAPRAPASTGRSVMDMRPPRLAVLLRRPWVWSGRGPKHHHVDARPLLRCLRDVRGDQEGHGRRERRSGRSARSCSRGCCSWARSSSTSGAGREAAGGPDDPRDRLHRRARPARGGGAGPSRRRGGGARPRPGEDARRGERDRCRERPGGGPVLARGGAPARGSGGPDRHAREQRRDREPRAAHEPRRPRAHAGRELPLALPAHRAAPGPAARAGADRERRVDRAGAVRLRRSRCTSATTTAYGAYARSKLAQITATFELADGSATARSPSTPSIPPR